MPEINAPLLQPDRTFAGQRSSSPAPSESLLVRPAAGSPDVDSEHSRIEAQSDGQAPCTAATAGRTFQHPVLMAVWLFISVISLTFFSLASIAIADNIWQLLVLPVVLPTPCFLMGTIGGTWYFCQSFSSRLRANLAAHIKLVHRLAVATLILSYLYLATPVYFIIALTKEIREYQPRADPLGEGFRSIAVLVLVWMIVYAFLSSAIVHKTTLANARLSYLSSACKWPSGPSCVACMRRSSCKGGHRPVFMVCKMA